MWGVCLRQMCQRPSRVYSLVAVIAVHGHKETLTHSDTVVSLFGDGFNIVYVQC